MKPLIVIVAICTLGYVADHWKTLTVKNGRVATTDAHGLIIYGSKSSPACVRLESQLDKQGIAYEKRDINVDANSRELTDKLVRVGKSGSQIAIPVADVDGVLMVGASIEQITKKLK